MGVDVLAPLKIDVGHWTAHAHTCWHLEHNHKDSGALGTQNHKSILAANAIATAYFSVNTMAAVHYLDL